MSASAELMLDIAAVRRDARRNGPLLRICHALERHLTEAASLPEDSGPASAASPITGDAAAASSDEVLRDIIRRIRNGLQHNFGDRSDIQAICAELERRLGMTGIRVMRVRVVRIGCKGTGATMNGTGRVSERGRGHERVAA